MLEARPGDAALLLELQTEAIAAAESPFPDALDKLQTLEQRLKQMTVDEKYTLPWNRHLYSQLLLPASYQVGVAFARSVAMQRSLLAVIAAERYERAEQKLAQSWEDLAPTFLAEVPLDPFNGAPLIFSRTKTGYLIYSVGKDRVDGGGDFGPNLQGNDWGIRVEREAQKP
jgi:hypothetical protein